MATWKDVEDEWRRLPDAAVEGAIIGAVIGLIGGAIFVWWNW
jgi:hypothetical protein